MRCAAGTNAAAAAGGPAPRPADNRRPRGRRPRTPVTNCSGSSRPWRLSAASRSPAAQPSVREHSADTSGGASDRPWASSSAPASLSVKASSAARISVSRPRTRSTCSGSAGSARALSTSRNWPGACSTRKLRSLRHSRERTMCRSSSTRITGASSSASALTNSGMKLARESRTGGANAASAEPSPQTPAISSEASTAAQKRAGSSSPVSSETHATRCPRPGPSAEDSSAVFPLPAGPQISVTGSVSPRSRRSTSRDRSTRPNGGGGGANCVISDGVPSDSPPGMSA